MTKELYMNNTIDFSKVVINKDLSYQEFNLYDGDLEVSIKVDIWSEDCRCGIGEGVTVSVFDMATGENGKIFSKEYLELPIEIWQKDIIELKNQVILKSLELDRGIF